MSVKHVFAAALLASAPAAPAGAEDAVAILIPSAPWGGVQDAFAAALADAFDARARETFVYRTDFGDPARFAAALEDARAKGAGVAVVPDLLPSRLREAAESGAFGDRPVPFDAENALVLGYGWNAMAAPPGAIVLSVPGNREIALDPARLDLWPLSGGTDEAQDIAETVRDWLESGAGHDIAGRLSLVPGLSDRPIDMVPLPDLDDDGCGCDDHGLDGAGASVQTCDPDGWQYLPGMLGFDETGAMRLGAAVSGDDGCGGGCDARIMSYGGFRASDLAGRLADANPAGFAAYVERMDALASAGRLVTVMTCDPD